MKKKENEMKINLVLIDLICVREKEADVTLQ